MRHTAASFRLGDDTLSLIDRLADVLPNRLGVTGVSATEVVRIAVRRLAEQEGVEAAPKKIRKKSRAGIDIGNTRP